MKHCYHCTTTSTGHYIPASTMGVHHHEKPPFARNIYVMSFFSKHQTYAHLRLMIPFLTESNNDTNDIMYGNFQCMVIFSDLPMIMYCLGWWCHILIPYNIHGDPVVIHEGFPEDL